MRRRLTATACAIIVATTLASAQRSTTPSSGPISPALDESPASWFVELDSPPTSDGTPMAVLDGEKREFHAAATAAGIRYVSGREFRSLWNGLVVHADEGSASQLLALSGVRAVYPVVNAVPAQRDGEPVNVADLATALTMTGADIAQHALGLTGRRVRVAVIDSGIDYDHPDLGGCFGAHCRVAKGYDFVGDGFNPDSASPTYDPRPRPDPDPDDCHGHGTHVAGIIGAGGGLTGVAPGVTFHAYRVFGCTGPTTTEIVLAALERALVDGADVVNLSLGTALQWPQYPTAQAADRLVRHGITVVASAGNDAGLGLYASSAPGTGRDVISVASFDNSHTNLAAFSVSPDQRLIGYGPAVGAPRAPLTGTFPLARTGTAATPDDACAPLAAGLLAGRVALIRRGTCSFAAKAVNAQAAGAAGVVFYNNVAGRVSATVAGGPPVNIPAVSISQADGALLDARLAAGAVSLTWTAGQISEPQATGGLISSFSSWGPAPDLSLKPDLGAPGGPIRSTLPLEQGRYGAISGTSQAAPHVSGAVALLIESNPDLSPADILGRLQSSARPSVWAGNPALGHLDAAHRQGAGLLTIDQAIESDVIVSPARLELGEFEGHSQVHAISLSGLPAHRRCHGWSHARGRGRGRHHDACRPVTYRLGHAPALATGANTFAPVLFAAFATVEFDRQTIALDEHPGRGHGHRGRRGTSWDDKGHGPTARVLVRVTPPAIPEVRLFGGYITLTPDDGGDVLRVPYVGYNGDYQAIAALTPTPFGFPWLARLTGSTLTNQPTGATFTMQGTDVPFVLYHLDHQVQLIKLKAVEVSTGRSFGVADRREYLARNSAPTSFFAFVWDGTTAHGHGSVPPTRVPNGTYRLEITVLKALGDRRQRSHVERWTSPDITIARPVP
jgi:subtilisin family serine protease